MGRVMLIFFMCLFSGSAYPAFFFRYSVVPPERVFQQGFLPLGNNSNVYQHIAVVSCFDRNANSRFISTSSSQLMAMEMANANTPIGSNYYLYRIRPTDNFYNSMNSVQAAMNRTHDERFLAAYFYYMLEEEWLAEGGISPQQIHSAIEYQSQGPHQEATLIMEYLNAAYIEAYSTPSNTVYSIPDLPAEHVNEPQNCTGCNVHFPEKKYKRSVKYELELWRMCSHKHLEIFFGD
ncbi:scabin-related ADP-ribosyltransferase [Symbiopectobacterium purcellii]|uniref:Uncharacterized protein n=1 Tax=Symbiopectobacterium purcellii TaxID=2871826 RepID=A0ABX9AP80_9ENTR|nr:enterotoxin A family protein [Symbiopectobacterium purcellii]QZN96121.1 hypothetical protein K6K13_01095 [Symbiopectobacterium purcellii]